MTTDGYIIGVDMGTGSARAGVFDATGKQYGFGVAPWETSYPQPGWAEQDPTTWWACTATAIREAVAKSGVDPDAIKALSMDATSCTVVSLDANDNVLRPALLWMDVRAIDQAERVKATGDPALKYCGQGPVSAEWGLPKAMWLKENEPDTFAKTATICDETDWLVNKLTGEWTMSVSHAAGKYFYDGDHGGWPMSLYQSLNADDILAKYPKRVAQVGDIIGTLLPEIAEELGLSPSTIVVQGGIDAYFGAVGLGVAQPGRLAMITGSSHVLTGQLASPIYTKGLWGSYTDATVPGYYTIDGGQVSTGSVIEWFLANLGVNARLAQKQDGADPYDILTRSATEIPIGSDGVIMLDHFQGNRAPHFDARSRGMFFGLSLHHTEGHLFRALLEGICYGTEAIFEVMRNEGVPLEEIIVSGPATKNPLWLQMHADVSNLPMTTTDVNEGPVLGSAMVAAVGAGMYPDIPSASMAMTRTAGTIEPDPTAHEQYQFYYHAYKDAYLAMKDVLASVTEHVSEGYSRK